MIYIYTDGSASNDKAAPAAVIDNSSSIEVFYKLHALFLALDCVKTADDDERNSIIFSNSKSALQAILGQLRLDASSCPQSTGTPPLASTVPREKSIILLDS